MINLILLYLGALFLLFWGAAHLFATRPVVEGFGPISAGNKRIITMEWIVEGVALILIAALVAVVTAIDYSSGIARAVYWICFAGLNTLSVVSLLTGFKVRQVPFKLCPVVFSTAYILILLGSYL